MKHFVIVGVLVLLCTLLLNMVLTTSNLLPAEASTQAVTVDKLFSVHFALISFLFSLIAVFIGYSIVVFRAKPGDKTSGAFFKYNNKLEVVWTILPLGTVMVLAYMGSQNLADTLRADPQAMEVDVQAYQWGWTFVYPSSGVTSNKLYLPVNQQVLLRMSSKDVIHSFWVPEFRVKQDVLPGANLVKSLRITPTEIGNYKVRCAELCGGAHAYMEAPVLVVSKADFDAWISSEMTTSVADPVVRGQKSAQNSGCLSCHSVDGRAGVGPTWKGLFGSAAELTDGTTVVVDNTYLLNSIKDPNAVIAKGFQPNIMPKTYATSLTEQQINDILSFIQSLR
jgi:cytochrome c oxidase subunit II